MNVCEWLAAGEVVTFLYQGRQREVKIAVHGTHVDTGTEQIRGYQVGGSSSQGELPGWRLFKVANMSGVASSGVPIGQLPADYNPDDLHLHVHCHVVV